ncbi:MAG: sulfurtransferase-like selenium metabolism protein YedF, partial [Desulfopila sp.]|nr:sulfurtransferase-like selenium metabolism protein YedF [Desulfopila sp.]
MAQTIDARGLTCPAPVLLVKESVEREKAQEIEVLVDNEASLENVGRFLSVKGYLVNDSREDKHFRITARRTGAAEINEQPTSHPVATEAGSRKILVVVTSDRIGRGDDVLGEKLMISYLKTLKELGGELWQLIFVNSGVKLTITDSPVLAELQQYEEDGVIVLACGTCLEHFQLTAEKKVGSTTNMLD